MTAATLEIIPDVSSSIPRSLTLATRSVALATPTFAAGIAQMGMDWTVTSQPMFLSDSTMIEHHRAILRDDTQRVLGIVGKKFTPVQNVQMAGDLDELFSGDLAGVARLERGGTFDGGKTVYMLARMPDALTLRLFGRDEIRPYLCFVDGKAGNSSLRMFPTTVRVVCQNTLRLAIGEHGSDGFTIRHTGSIHTRRESAIRAMKNFGQAIKTHHEAMSFLASKTLTSERIIALVADEILAPESGKEQSHQAKRKVETIIDLVEGGIGTDIPGVRGTAYGVFQAVTEFASHYAPARGTLTEQAESRLERVLGGDKLSQRALEVMLAA